MRRLIDKYPVWTVMGFMLLCLSGVMAMRDFSPSNELRYLSIADEALRDGHVFAFANQGAAYADKPPLYLWIVMLCRLLLGKHSMFVLSLCSFIPACVIIWVMDRWVYGREPEAAGAWRASTALMLGTAGLFLGMSVFLRMDMLMVMFIVLALWSWHRDRPWLFALYTFLALFTKGPVGLLVPPLCVTVYCASCRWRRCRSGRAAVPAERRRGTAFESTPHNRVSRWLGWRFWALLAGLCTMWFAGVYIDGGREYLDNLLFHQTVGRAVNSFHHDRPLWYYLVNVWPVLLPWCLLVVPAAVLSLCRRGDTALPEVAALSDTGTAAGHTEKMFRCAVFVTFVMLSCFSAKLSIYLAPIFPFVIYLVPLLVKQDGWKRWMSWAVAVPAGLLSLVGLALVALVPLWGMLPVPEGFGFARSPLVMLAGAVLAAGGVCTVVSAFSGRSRGFLLSGGDFPSGGNRPSGDLAPAGGYTCTAPLAVSMLAGILLLSPLLPQANDWVGYGNLCADIPDGETVYVRKVHRPENMDVYLGRDVVKISADDPIPGDGVLVSKASFEDESLEGRTKIVHGEYAVWLPR